MKDATEMVEKLSSEEISEIRAAGPGGVLTQAALNALDRAAGGPGLGHGYYVSAGTVDENGTPEFVLHSSVADAILGHRE